MTKRTITHRYEDPLDLVWRRCATELGFDIVRSGEVYASFDGHRRISLSTPDDFDADDSLAQMILHELCHALIAGPDALTREDWGLDNTSERDLEQEHATHRLQAHLADRWGLRALFAVTTQWRDHWDRLPRDPLAGDTPAAIRAREARQRADRDPWAGALRRAFGRTAEMADLARLRRRPRQPLGQGLRARARAPPARPPPRSDRRALAPALGHGHPSGLSGGHGQPLGPWRRPTRPP